MSHGIMPCCMSRYSYQGNPRLYCRLILFDIARMDVRLYITSNSRQYQVFYTSPMGRRYTVMQSFKAYILLRRKTIPVGSSHWLRPPMPQFRITYTNMLVSKKAKIRVNPNAKPKMCVTPNANPQRKSVEYTLHWVSWH